MTKNPTMTLQSFTIPSHQKLKSDSFNRQSSQQADYNSCKDIASFSVSTFEHNPPGVTTVNQLSLIWFGRTLSAGCPS